jgi:succinate dehydrogenase/fumarate reductase cytochrome b subunit
MKLWQKKILQKGSVQLLYGALLALIIMFVFSHVLIPLLYTSNPQSFENYESIIPAPLYPIIIFIIIGSFLYHYTNFVITIYKKYNEK